MHETDLSSGTSKAIQLRGLTESVGKDHLTEEKLSLLNQLLKPLEQTLQSAHQSPTLPVSLILGAPRSGTTLLSQILAGTGAFSWTSNLSARFWLAPTLGIHIAQALGVIPGQMHSSHQSSYGRTEGWAEPHEFGYFWSHWFDHDQDTHFVNEAARAKIDLPGLLRALASMEAAAGRPLLFKNNTWFTLQADWLARNLGNPLLLVCERDPVFLAQSYWKARLSNFGTADKWWSVRPSAYRTILTLPPVKQVAHQAVSLVQEMEYALNKVPEKHILRISYQVLCKSPRDIVQMIDRKLINLGNPPLHIDYDRLEKSFQSNDVISLDRKLFDQIEKEVKEAINSGRYKIPLMT